MKINEEDLRSLLNESFEAGFYGCKDLQDDIVEELVNRVKKKDETVISCSSEISISPFYSKSSTFVIDHNHDSSRFVLNRNRDHYSPETVVEMNTEPLYMEHYGPSPLLEFRRTFMDIQNDNVEDTSL